MGSVMYTVKQVAALTGVRASTLRAWERRYAVVDPARSDGGYRLYLDDQVARLRGMAALVRGGVPASQAAAVVRTASFATRTAQGFEVPEDDDLVAAAVALDPAWLQGIIEHAFSAGPFEQVIDGWLLPQLRLLGDGWAEGSVSIGHEHFASAGLMRAIAGVFDEASNGSADAPVLVGLPAGARHELALFAFAACLRRRGVGVVYLGADVPTADWVTAAAARLPRAVVLGVHTEDDVQGAQEVADRLSEFVPPVGVFAGGGRRGSVRGVELLPDGVSEAAAALQRVLLAGGT